VCGRLCVGGGAWLWSKSVPPSDRHLQTADVAATSDRRAAGLLLRAGRRGRSGVRMG